MDVDNLILLPGGLITKNHPEVLRAVEGSLGYYSRPYLNHFTQPDTIVPDQYNSADYDRYSYVRNNPLRYTDPSGHRCKGRDEDIWGGCITDWPSDVQKVAINLHKLGVWENTQAAMKYVVSTEYGPGNLDKPDEKLPNLSDAMKNRYGEFCSGGAWTIKCVQSFWGYMQGTINPDANALANYDAAMKNYSSNVSALAQNIIDSKQSCGSSNICAWATIIPGSMLYTCLSTNPGCWAQNNGVKQYAFGNTAYVSWLSPSNSAFIVLSIPEQETICANPKWNLPSSCSLLQIP